MRIARFLIRSTSRPRVGLERDGTVYDVQALETALGAAVEVPGDAWDFHTRVAALGCAGLRELDAALLQGQRPASAVVPAHGVAALAPCDTDRALYVHVDTRAGNREPAFRLGLARALAVEIGVAIVIGDDLVDLPSGERTPAVEIGVAIVIGDDLRDATPREAKSAILGASVLCDFRARDTEARAQRGATARGLRTQIGPSLVAIGTLPKPAALRVSLTVRGERHELGCLGDLGISFEDAVAFASSHVALEAGDVVGVGPVPFGASGVRELGVEYHEKIEVAIERMGTLRGAAVERR